MRNLLAFFGAMVITFAGVGWYLGWYDIQSEPNADGKRSYRIDIDTQKLSQDTRAGAKSVARWLDKASEDKDDEKKTAEKKTEELSPFEKIGFDFTSSSDERQ